MQKQHDNKKYVYSSSFANKLIQDGYHCIGTGFNANSSRFWWAFNYNDVCEWYSKNNVTNK